MNHRSANTFDGSARILLAAQVLACLSLPALANVGLPVSVSLASADALRRGEPVNVIVVIQSATDMEYAKFEVGSSTDWQLLDGTTHWAGTIQKGQTVQLRFRAIALADQPQQLPASLSVPGQPAMVVSLDPNRLGGRFPERAKANPADYTGDAKAEGRAAGESPIAFQHDPSIPLPEPLAATEPRIPGQDPPAVNSMERPASSKSRKERGATFTVSGRFTYLDDNGVRHGVRTATVELWNLRSGLDVLEDKCDTGVSDDSGNFSLQTNCSDLFDGPDLAARIVLNNSTVEVKPDNIFAGDYTFQTGTRNNVTSDTINFGVITITSNRGAFQAHNLITRAHNFMSTQGENLSKVTVLWPSADSSPVSFYSPFPSPSIHLIPVEPFSDEGAVFHEYGHHILGTLAESPMPDYNNGNCDTPGHPGHCIDQPELGAIAWTEGFPDFFAAVLYAKHEGEDGYGANTMYRFESHPTDFQFPGQEDHTEAFVASVLWDLFDTVDDDQDAQGPGHRDNISIGFSGIWSVIRNFDPDPNIFHSHPTSVQELWQGLRAANIGQINRVSEVYVEHEISAPQPDLTVTGVQTAPTSIPRGASFSIDNTVRNSGGELANSSFTVRFRLVPPVINSRTGGNPVVIGSRNVPANLGAQTNNGAVTILTVPSNTPAGTYVLQVCADSGGTVAESNETNNCKAATGAVIVQ